LKKKARRVLFLVTGALWIALTLGVMVNAASALLTARTGFLVNPLAIGNTGVTVEETVDGWLAKQVRLRIPTGPAYVKSIVRAMIVPYIYDGDGKLIASDLGAMAAPVGNQMALGDVILEFDSAWATNWFYKDGFFYYRTVLEPAGGQNQTAVSTGSSIWVMIRMVLVLALAAAAVYGVVFFIKRASKPAVASDPFLKILANVSLGSNRYAHIVSVGGKAWLLGSSDGGVNLIGEIDDRDVINAMLLEDSRKSADSQTGRFSDFVSMLRRFGAQTESRAAKADDIRKRRERLKGL
jgi:flagellar protein FliO/FliZ